ncbi:winged helix-turn-helix transcriptional regulator [Dietzia sp.]|uniref:winged helix-turn-helix transcriptional regulator n=1 Tax=Dietzia sp. TaxID=1871616 RepID=UPI002FDA48D5
MKLADKLKGNDDPPPQRWAAAQTAATRWNQTAGAQLLVVDPSPADRDFIKALQAHGTAVTWVGSTLHGLVELGRREPVAVIVGAEGLGASAVDFVEAVREYSATFTLAGLKMADDPSAESLRSAGAGAIITRPYSAVDIWEILERNVQELGERLHLTFGPVELDSSAYTVTIDGVRIGDLPLKQFELLRALMLSAPGILSDQELRSRLWGDADPQPNTVHVHVGRLRERLARAVEIRRIRGQGYALARV